MAPKHHPTPLSGGDRKALHKELAKSRAMTTILAERAAEKRRDGEALIREADRGESEKLMDVTFSEEKKKSMRSSALKR